MINVVNSQKMELIAPKFWVALLILGTVMALLPSKANGITEASAAETQNPVAPTVSPLASAVRISTKDVSAIALNQNQLNQIPAREQQSLEKLNSEPTLTIAQIDAEPNNDTTAPMAQVTSVSQLSDVQSTDWALSSTSVLSRKIWLHCWVSR